jgi:hypothetical protein
MDADRRIKTVIAGTFAIGRKSLSNAQPISAGETQRTKAEMTMAAMQCQSLTKPRAGGIYARVATASSTLSDGKTGARRCTHAREGGWALFRKARPGRGQGKIGGRPRELPLAPRCFPEPSGVQNFFEADNV